MMLKISLLQINIALGDVAANEKKVETLVLEALREKPDVIVLPELWNTGYDLGNLHQLAQKEKGSSLSLLKKLALNNNVNFIGGSVVESKEGKYHNMLPIINRSGDIEEKYRKAHLFPLILEEEKYFTAGDQWGLGTLDGIPVGVMLCYDLRFPEFCRNLVLRGANIIFVPAQWPRERINHWRILLQSRAIENQAFVVGVNRVGQDNSSAYSGHSLIIDPFGNILAEGEESESIISANLDLSLISENRKKIPSLLGRMNILDEIDNNYL